MRIVSRVRISKDDIAAGLPHSSAAVIVLMLGIVVLVYYLKD